jgi:hypothetical protein
LTPGEPLGDGELDRPTSTEPDDGRCLREREDVVVVSLTGIDPKVAIAIEGRPATIFVLGSPCAGYAPEERVRCLREPLDLRGIAYTGSSYPAGPAESGTRGEVSLGEEIGEADLGGEAVTVRAIEGVDPAVAVGVDGRPSEAFLAPGVCPYERFQNEPALDDLARCLRAPIWLVFDPPGAQVGDEVVAHPDRPFGSEVAGAPVALIPLPAAGDALPDDLSGAVEVGSVAGSEGVRFTVPDLPEGFYEAVVTVGGEASPAGSILVVEEQEGSSSIRIISILLAVALVVAIGASVWMWRRTRRLRRPEVGPSGDG